MYYCHYLGSYSRGRLMLELLKSLPTSLLMLTVRRLECVKSWRRVFRWPGVDTLPMLESGAGLEDGVPYCRGELISVITRCEGELLEWGCSGAEFYGRGVCTRVCVRACVRVRMRACVRMCVCVCVNNTSCSELTKY